MVSSRAALAVLVLLGAALIGPGAARPASANHNGVYLSWATAWSDGTDLHVAGEIVNATNNRRQAVKVDVEYFNSDDDLIGTGTTFTVLDNLAPHSASPFRIDQPTIADFDHFHVEVSSLAATSWPISVIDITYGAPFTDGLLVRHFPGEITNLGATAITNWEVGLTLFNGANVINTAALGPTADTIDPGETVAFDIELADHYASATHHRFTSQAAVVGGGYATSWDNYFTDLGGTSFRDDVLWVAEAGITSGCAPALYCPTQGVTRGQMASFLSRALDLPSTGTDFFTDDETSTHETAINRVAAAGIASGCTATTFCPGRAVTRGEMATFLSRALDLPGTATDYFTDDEGSTHETAINRVRAAGIASGCTTTTFCPNTPVTRGQMAAFLHRAFD
jgi:hypothetical protein